MTSTVVSMFAAALLLGAAVATLGGLGGFGPAYFAASLGLAGVVAVLVLAFLPERLPNDRFGPANFVTLTRAFLTCVLAGAIGAGPASAATVWTLCGLAVFALLLDGVDGWLARTRNETSAFGARFDMESDSLYLLALSLLIYDLDKAGPWVLLAGLARYAFVAAAFICPWLSAELPESRRRKGVFAFQAGLFVLCLAPAVPASVSAPLAAVGVCALLASFALDVVWLARQRPKGGINP